MQITPIPTGRMKRSVSFGQARAAGDGPAKHRFKTGDELPSADRSARSLGARQRLVTVVPIVGYQRRDAVGSLGYRRHDFQFVVEPGDTRPYARPWPIACLRDKLRTYATPADIPQLTLSPLPPVTPTRNWGL